MGSRADRRSLKGRLRRADFGMDVATYFNGDEPPAHFAIRRNPGPRTYTFGCPCGKAIERSTTPALGAVRAVEAFAREHGGCARG